LIPDRSRTSTLVARDLKKSYGDFEAVKGVDFEVHGGECFGFLGPNGAGKTTTMKMIYGAVIPTEGELDVAGLDVRSCEREIKRRIGVVPQENNLDDDLEPAEAVFVSLGAKPYKERPFLARLFSSSSAMRFVDAAIVSSSPPRPSRFSVPPWFRERP
jgi:ABC-type multidrug transport system ATPase subunit